MDTKTLAVTQVVALPHRISTGGVDYTFNPTADVPARIADALVKANPKVYFIPKGKVSTGGYRLRANYGATELQNLTKGMTPEQIAELCEAAELIKKGNTLTDDADDAAVQIDELKARIAGLQDTAQKQKLEISELKTKLANSEENAKLLEQQLIKANGGPADGTGTPAAEAGTADQGKPGKGKPGK